MARRRRSLRGTVLAVLGLPLCFSEASATEQADRISIGIGIVQLYGLSGMTATDVYCRFPWDASFTAGSMRPSFVSSKEARSI